MSSETGVGKTKLLTVYHKIVGLGAVGHTPSEDALLGLLHTFITSHVDELLPIPAEGQQVVLLQEQHPAPAAVAPQIADSLRQQREEGVDPAGLYSIASDIVTLLRLKDTESSDQVLAAFYAMVSAFIHAQLSDSKLLDHEQLAWMLHSLSGDEHYDEVMGSAAAASAAYKRSPAAWKALQLEAQDVIDSFLADPTQIITREMSANALLLLAGVLCVGHHSTFQAMQMHAQVTTAAMWARLYPFISLARRCPAHHFTFFVDELNTSSMMGEMKSIFIDNTFDGKCLPSNIFWVSAINPVMPDSAAQTADGGQHFSGRYAVHPCPASMEEVVWAFGSMTHHEEKAYIAAKLQMVAAEWTGLLDFSQDTCRLLMRYITAAQASVCKQDIVGAHCLHMIVLQHVTCSIATMHVSASNARVNLSQRWRLY